MNKIQMKQELEMVEMYKSGLPMATIAQKFKVSSGTVYYCLKLHVPKTERLSRKRRGINILDEITIEELERLYKKGYSTVKLARKLGVSPNTVWVYLNKSGVSTSKGAKYASKVDKGKLEKIKKIYEETGSILETAKLVGLHPSSVHYRLTKLGLVKNKFINQKIAKRKYRILTNVLVKLFKAMGYEIRYVQHKYNGHGPDMILDSKEGSIIVEHKASVKLSGYWKHAIEEAKNNIEKYNSFKAIVVSTSTKPKKYPKIENIEILFLEDLKDLLKKFNLESLIENVEFISSTPSV